MKSLSSLHSLLSWALPLAVACFPIRSPAASIYGGKPAKAGELPWQVYVEQTKGTNPTQKSKCGGTILGASWVLTAKHCLVMANPDATNIYAGMLDITNEAPTRTAKKIILHPSVDFGLIELSSPLPLGPSIRAAAYATKADSTAGKTKPGVLGKVSGWGEMEDGWGADVLMVDEMPIVDWAYANRPEGNNGDRLPSEMPAGFDEGGKAVAFGDSGGPFVVPDGLGGWLLAGVVSRGWYLPGTPNKYSLFVRVSSYADWIEQTTGIPGGIHPVAIDPGAKPQLQFGVTVREGGIFLDVENPQFLEVTAQGLDGRSHALTRRFFQSGRHRLETGSLARGAYILGTGPSRPGQRIWITP